MKWMFVFVKTYINLIGKKLSLGLHSHAIYICPKSCVYVIHGVLTSVHVELKVTNQSLQCILCNIYSMGLCLARILQNFP